MRATTPDDNHHLNLSQPDDILRRGPMMKLIIMHFLQPALPFSSLVPNNLLNTPLSSYWRQISLSYYVSSSCGF